MYRDTYLEINLDKISKNVEILLINIISIITILEL